MQIMYKLSKYFNEILKLSSVNTILEINTLDEIFKNNNVKSVLDIACGTGRHCIPLSQLGYDVTGIDYSPWQIKQAKIDAIKNKSNSNFLIKDANKFVSKKKFDAAICMWSTIAEEPMIYQQVAKNAFDSLNENGIFIIDNKNWNMADKSLSVKKDSLKKNGLIIKRKIWDIYTDHFRVRQALFEINGKKYNELCITNLVDCNGFISEFKKIGFKKFEVLYDYKKVKSIKAKRFMIIAHK